MLRFFGSEELFTEQCDFFRTMGSNAKKIVMRYRKLAVCRSTFLIFLMWQAVRILLHKVAQYHVLSDNGCEVEVSTVVWQSTSYRDATICSGPTKSYPLHHHTSAKSRQNVWFKPNFSFLTFAYQLFLPMRDYHAETTS